METEFSCNLPDKTIYISQDGTVRVCCYNHLFEVGDLKNNTLLEIWNSKNRIDFAQNLYNRSNELSCRDCTAKQQHKKNFLTFKKSFTASKFPESIEFELSNKCNLECTMCSSLFSDLIAKKNSLPHHNLFDFGNIICEIEPFIPYLKEVKFYGGEPFLIQKYYEIWENIIENNPACKIYLQTNGTILNDKIKELLNKGIFNIGVSLESINEETYKKIRINASLKPVLSNIDYFHNYARDKKTFFGISVCPIRENWKELPELVEYFNKSEIPVNFHEVVQPFHVSLWNLGKDRLFEIYQFLSQYTFKNNTNAISYSNIKRFRQLVTQISNWHRESEEREKAEVDFSNKSLIEIKNNIINNIFLFLKELNWMNNTSKENKIKHFTEKLNDVCDSIPDKELLKSKLIILQNIPVQILISEIERVSVIEIKNNLLSL